MTANRTEQVFVSWCPRCQAVTQIAVVTDEWFDGKLVSGGYACSKCQTRLTGVWANDAELTLFDVDTPDRPMCSQLGTADPWPNGFF